MVHGFAEVSSSGQKCNGTMDAGLEVTEMNHVSISTVVSIVAKAHNSNMDTSKSALHVFDGISCPIIRVDSHCHKSMAVWKRLV